MDRQFATTLARGIQILRCFRPTDYWLTNKEISLRTRLPRPTVSRLTYTLVQLDCLNYDTQAGKYALGTGVLSMAYPMLAPMRIRQVSRPFMKALADAVNASVSMGVRNHLTIVHVETCRSAGGEATLPDIGLITPLALSAVGRAYLAVCPERERESLFNQLKVAQPEIWEAQTAQLHQQFQHYRQTGFSSSYGEVRKDVNAVGVAFQEPISGKVFSFCLSAPASLYSRERFEHELGLRLARMVQEVVARI